MELVSVQKMRRTMQSERQLACYSLLEDNGNETGMIIVVGRTKKTTFHYCRLLLGLIQFTFFVIGARRVEFCLQKEFHIKNA